MKQEDFPPTETTRLLVMEQETPCKIERRSGQLIDHARGYLRRWFSLYTPLDHELYRKTGSRPLLCLLIERLDIISRLKCMSVSHS